MEPIGKALARISLPTTAPPDSRPASDVTPKCRLCGDSYWIHPLRENGKPDWGRTVRCPCQEQADRKAKLERVLRYCRLPDETEHKTFDRFQTFGDPVLEEAKRLVMNIGAPESVFLTLLAESDRGKSHLGIAACRSWVNQGRPAMYASVPWLLGELRNGFVADGDAAYWPRLNLYCQVSLLVLDDLGTERMTEWGAEQIQTIVDYRYERALPLLVTSNRPIDDLFNFTDHRQDLWRDYANMRVGSRLQREFWCKVLVLDCPAFSTRDAKSQIVDLREVG